MELKRVVVTGLGALTPLGHNVEETWEALKSGKSGAGPITHFDASQFKTQFACEVKNFNAADYIDRKEARKMDSYEQYAVVAAMEAMKDIPVRMVSYGGSNYNISFLVREEDKVRALRSLSASIFDAK